MKTESTAQQLFHKLKYCWQPIPKRGAPPQDPAQPLATVVRDVVNRVDNTPRSTQAMRAQNALLRFVEEAAKAQEALQPVSHEARKLAFKDMRVIQHGLKVERDKARLERGQVESHNYKRYEELKALAQQARAVKHLLKP
ncbi:MAG: hypothetical protein ACREPC_13045 [Stenotrophomonas sp.]|uniref:hypothetical protein n=1 Tax=Stenotrophomonas sp. TaxID=69392 RepID=UPI003D6DA2FE